MTIHQFMAVQLSDSKMMKHLVFLLLLSTLIESKYEIILDRMELLFENDSYIDQGTFRVKKFNRST